MNDNVLYHSLIAEGKGGAGKSPPAKNPLPLARLIALLLRGT
jgi:hypothetical protein